MSEVFNVDVGEGMKPKNYEELIPGFAEGWEPPDGWRFPSAFIRMLEDYHHDTQRSILARADEMWDLTSPFPMPKFTPYCDCGKPRKFVPRYWLFHDYPEGAGHKVRRRCDVSLKCCWCGGIYLAGVVLPENHESPPQGRYMWKQVYQWLKGLPSSCFGIDDGQERIDLDDFMSRGIPLISSEGQ